MKAMKKMTAAMTASIERVLPGRREWFGVVP